MFESLVSIGLKGFLGCPAVIHEAALLEFFENGSVRDGLVVSTVNGVTVEISEQLFAETFELPVEGLTDLSEIPKDLVFDSRSIVSLSGEPVSISGKNKEMTIEFRLLCDILAKTISVKTGSFDAITQEKFMMMAAITCGVRINWNRLMFNILKDMVTPGLRQAKGYAIQISLLLENVPNLELGESSEFPSSKILTNKTVHRYVVLNDKVGVEGVTDESRVKKTHVKRAASKKRPTAAEAEPVVKKKRTTKSKSVSSKDTLDILLVAHEAVPLQMIAPTPVALAEQPPVPKQKTHKRKRRLILSPDDEIVDSGTATAEPAIGGSVEEESILGRTIVEQGPAAESVEERENEPVVESTAEVLRITSADDVDFIIQQVITETAQLETDGGEHVDEPDVSRATVEDQAVGKADELERWFDLPYEVLFAGDTEQMVTTASDTDEEMEPVDVETGVELSTDEAMSGRYFDDYSSRVPIAVCQCGDNANYFRHNYLNPWSP
ncbi:hypothetical protein F511_12137 [Dorcoceras hygrometricum]|uniref:Dystroglycan-like n=1 Tax=Dorcoceras hygrometricum TaxID=472368 RepID=A0A2Z7C4G6_9LAMI|nr:hypothetical protein F511_12137 [Dorcoceras hygrometricum]